MLLKLHSQLKKFTPSLLKGHVMYTNKLLTHTPSEGPRVAPSGAVVEQVVPHMGCILNSLGAGREIAPLGQEPVHKDRKRNSST